MTNQGDRSNQTEVVKWADRAMYQSAGTPDENRAPGGGVMPTVRLLNATPDPLGSLAAICGIYTGKVHRSLSEISDDDRRAALNAMLKTELSGPLECIQLHFLVEGVTRAFTHQAVRNRFSFFAQESMRFAVVDGEDWVDRQAYPPSLAASPVPSHIAVPSYGGGPMKEYEPNPDYGPEELAYALQRDAWDDAIIAAQQAYQRLINAGVPAEDARGLMPHSITTRYHWLVSYRTLLSEAGKRLCTQAQFEWRTVMAQVAAALRGYGEIQQFEYDSGNTVQCDVAWQWKALADHLRPVCYAAGRCTFMADFDRNCSIRDRVEANAAIGRPSSEWHERKEVYRPVGDHREMLLTNTIEPIHPREWLADPNAAR